MSQQSGRVWTYRRRRRSTETVPVTVETVALARVSRTENYTLQYITVITSY